MEGRAAWHRVTYANDPAFADVVRDAGAESKPYRSTSPGPDEAWTGDQIDNLTAFLDDAVTMLPQLRAAYEQDRPDSRVPRRRLDVADLGEIPATVEAHPWVAQTAILAQADAFITHAGMGGSVEGLYYGTPML